MIIVTSGHVDHGKTALLQALTGKHTAHLPEEKKRGMTIDLGYAYLPFSSAQGEQVLGFIDVPGHERFLGNMLAGLGGIHYAMLIIAADDGIQAQTKEHLAILRLLQFEKIMVVLTKSDRVSSQRIDDLKHKIKDNYPFLTDSPFFITSTVTQQGITELRQFLTTLPNLANNHQPFRYAIDRVFTVKGAGTVVTGTAFSGIVHIDDELFLSNGKKVRVKNIHAQNQPSAQGQAGQRLALNIHMDIDRTLIERGDWLLTEAPNKAVDRITVELQTECILNESQPVHLYHAASHTVGKLSLLNTKHLFANQTGIAEIILDKPLFLTFGDKLILRSGDNKTLIAGARVLEIHSPKRYKRSEMRLQYLAALKQAQNATERLSLYLQGQAILAQSLRWTEQLTDLQLSDLLTQNRQVRFQNWCFNADYQTQQSMKILTALADYHQQHTDQIGVAKARLYRMTSLNQPEPLIYYFIDQLITKGALAQSRGWLHLPEHKLEFSLTEQQLWQSVQIQFLQANGQPLWVRDVATALSIDETEMRNFLYKAGKLGYLMPVVKDRFFLTEQVYAYATQIKLLSGENGEVTVNQLRDEWQFGRKLTVQLVEYFDRSGFLRRKGNVHILRDADIFAGE